MEKHSRRDAEAEIAKEKKGINDKRSNFTRKKKSK
jgi:hypothetical protein